MQSESFFEAHQATGNKNDARARFGVIDSLMARKLINHQQNEIVLVRLLVPKKVSWCNDGKKFMDEAKPDDAPR